jgi:uncharacterized membrane protein required for colicin V production
MKKFLLLSVIGSILGNFAATFFGPAFLRWWFEPPVNTPINCTEAMSWAMDRLVTSQMVGSCVGLIIGFIAAMFFFNSKTKTAA